MGMMKAKNNISCALRLSRLIIPASDRVVISHMSTTIRRMIKCIIVIEVLFYVIFFTGP